CDSTSNGAIETNGAPCLAASSGLHTQQQGISVNVDPVFCTWLLYQPHRGSGMQQGRFSRLCWFRQVLQLEATHQAVKDRGEDHDLLDQEKMSNKELRTDGQGKKDLCVKRQRDAPGLVPLAKRREDE
ncbi:hypothetical protein KUCAC02_037736, partial [Chaenocephalus aceratus]